VSHQFKIVGSTTNSYRRLRVISADKYALPTVADRRPRRRHRSPARLEAHHAGPSGFR